MNGPSASQLPRDPVGGGPRSRDWLSALATIAGMVGLYFMVPLGQRDDPLPVAVATAAAIATVMVLALMIWRRIVRILDGVAEAGLPSLLIILTAVIVAFSAGYYLLAKSDPGQVAGLRTRLDALYFTLTTLVTVGYGDIHPAGQAARAIACFQFVFNAIFLGGLLRATIYQVKLVREARTPPPEGR